MRILAGLGVSVSISAILAGCSSGPRIPEVPPPPTEVPAKSLGTFANPALASAADSPLAAAAVAPSMTVHVIDVEQGEAILVEFPAPCGAMLFDTGGEYWNKKFPTNKVLLDYLKAFFERRADLNRTIAVVFASHPHGDHTHGLSVLKDPANGIVVQNFVDDGIKQGVLQDDPDQHEFRDWALHNGVQYRGVTVDDLSGVQGFHDRVVDPFEAGNCGGLDPDIRALWGGSPGEAGSGPYENPNNHSLAVKVSFGKASFLFVGDLEVAGEKTMVSRYAGTDALDVDVYQAAHHGASNGSVTELLDAVSPEIVVIPMGNPDARKWYKRTAYQYGHPNAEAVQRCVDHLAGDRANPKDVKVGDRSKTFRTIHLSKRLYGTGWDGTIRIVARTNGSYQIFTER